MEQLGHEQVPMGNAGFQVAMFISYTTTLAPYFGFCFVIVETHRIVAAFFSYMTQNTLLLNILQFSQLPIC